MAPTRARRRRGVRAASMRSRISSRSRALRVLPRSRSVAATSVSMRLSARRSRWRDNVVVAGGVDPGSSHPAEQECGPRLPAVPVELARGLPHGREHVAAGVVLVGPARQLASLAVGESLRPGPEQLEQLGPEALLVLPVEGPMGQVVQHGGPPGAGEGGGARVLGAPAAATSRPRVVGRARHGPVLVDGLGTYRAAVPGGTPPRLGKGAQILSIATGPTCTSCLGAGPRCTARRARRSGRRPAVTGCPGPPGGPVPPTMSCSGAAVVVARSSPPSPPPPAAGPASTSSEPPWAASRSRRSSMYRSRSRLSVVDVGVEVGSDDGDRVGRPGHRDDGSQTVVARGCRRARRAGGAVSASARAVSVGGPARPWPGRRRPPASSPSGRRRRGGWPSPPPAAASSASRRAIGSASITSAATSRARPWARPPTAGGSAPARTSRSAAPRPARWGRRAGERSRHRSAGRTGPRRPPPG